MGRGRACAVRRRTSSGSSISKQCTAHLLLLLLLLPPQAIAYLAEALQELPHNPDTYEWNAVFNRLDPNALKDRTFSLHVFLNNRGQGLGELPHTDSGRIDVTELHLRQEYCGSYGGFVTYMGDMPGHIHKVCG